MNKISDYVNLSMHSADIRYIYKIQPFDTDFELQQTIDDTTIGWIGKLNNGEYTGHVFFDVKDPIDGTYLRSSNNYQSWNDTPELLLQSLQEKYNDIHQLANDMKDPFKRLDYLVKNYDWYYYMSDSYGVYVAGERWHKRTIRAYETAKEINEEQANAIWNSYAPLELHITNEKEKE